MSDRWTDRDQDRQGGRFVRNDDLAELGDGGRNDRSAGARRGYGPGYGVHPTGTPPGGYPQRGPGPEGDHDREDRSWFPHEVSDESFNRLYRQGVEGQRNGPPLKGGEPFGEHRGKGPRNFRRTDERIMEDLNERLTEDSRLDASDIEVACTGGEVTLNGTVSSKADKRRAEDLADSVGGVGHVQNNLRVAETFR